MELECMDSDMIYLMVFMLFAPKRAIGKTGDFNVVYTYEIRQMVLARVPIREARR